MKRWYLIQTTLNLNLSPYVKKDKVSLNNERTSAYQEQGTCWRYRTREEAIRAAEYAIPFVDHAGSAPGANYRNMPDRLFSSSLILAQYCQAAKIYPAGWNELTAPRFIGERVHLGTLPAYELPRPAFERLELERAKYLTVRGHEAARARSAIRTARDQLWLKLASVMARDAWAKIEAHNIRVKAQEQAQETALALQIAVDDELGDALTTVLAPDTQSAIAEVLAAAEEQLPKLQ